MPDSAYENKWGKGPHVSVDAVLFYGDYVLLIQRKDGQWALPGGFVEPEETLRQAISRELKEEANWEHYFWKTPHHYDRVDRDSRSRIITFAFFDEVSEEDDYACFHEPEAGSDAIDAEFMPLYKAHKLSLYADHNQILVDAVVARKK